MMPRMVFSSFSQRFSQRFQNGSMSGSPQACSIFASRSDPCFYLNVVFIMCSYEHLNLRGEFLGVECHSRFPCAVGSRQHAMDLNESQRTAAQHGIGDSRLPAPLLILAGAGTGKTKTLAYRVAYLVLNGTDPQRILLLTFTRRAAAEMIRRAARILGQACSRPQRTGEPANVRNIIWSGTFHAIANRLLRLHAHTIGLDPSFSVLDRSDAADLMNLVRND